MCIDQVKFTKKKQVIHALIGLVRAPVTTTFIQVLSRVALTFVCMKIPIVSYTDCGNAKKKKQTF